MPETPAFLKFGDHLIPVSGIKDVDITEAEKGIVLIEYEAGGELRRAEALGFDAINVVMALRPDALEGRRFKYPNNAWAVHNLLGHPLMQIFAWAGAYKTAMWIHDRTAPKPVDFHPKLK